MKVQRFYDAGHIASRLGTDTRTVLRWADRPTSSFPLPLYVFVDKDGKERPLWKEDQLPPLRAWLALRLNLSDPNEHWAMVDRGEEHPGGHQDQEELFAIRGQKQGEPDGLFTF